LAFASRDARNPPLHVKGARNRHLDGVEQVARCESEKVNMGITVGKFERLRVEERRSSLGSRLLLFFRRSEVNTAR
jgi:hypothetical protein